MNLTKSQEQIVNKAKQLEQQYGEGNVFVRWINDYWRVMFIVHHANETNFNCKLEEQYKVNGRAVNALMNKGLTEIVDNEHNIMDDPNDCKYIDNKFCVGSRIKTELFQ